MVSYIHEKQGRIVVDMLKQDRQLYNMMLDKGTFETLLKRQQLILTYFTKLNWLKKPEYKHLLLTEVGRV